MNCYDIKNPKEGDRCNDDVHGVMIFEDGTWITNKYDKFWVDDETGKIYNGAWLPTGLDGVIGSGKESLGFLKSNWMLIAGVIAAVILFFYLSKRKK